MTTPMQSQAKALLMKESESLLQNARVRELVLSQDIGELTKERDRDARRVFELLVDNVMSALSMLEGRIRPGQSILEIGGGSGMVHIVLKKMGYSIVSIEPALVGHDGSYELGTILMQCYGVSGNGWLPLCVDQVGQINSQFDLIFSQNVLEHIDDLGGSFTAMVACLKPGGVMLHNCPNYTVPYEPHFGIPLVPMAPRTTEWIVPSLKNSSLWNGLNFVTATRVKKIAEDLGLSIQFDRGHFYETWLRFGSEPQFREKHPGLYKVFLVMQKLGLLSLLKWIPPQCVTPMRFVAVKQQ